MESTTLHRADTRGHAVHGWLDSHHSFSFAGYYNPERIHFGALRVLNDDIVQGGMGFGTHPHDNMEIISIPLSGALQHKDTTGRNEIIKTGDVQIMSAGTGIAHSEYNASQTESVNFLQIWIFPKNRNIQPRYEQKTFDVQNRGNKLQLVVSPNGESGALAINQDAWLSLIRLEEGNTASYKLHQNGNGIYAFVIEGELKVNDDDLKKRDGLGIADANEIFIQSTANSELLLIEVPMEV